MKEWTFNSVTLPLARPLLQTSYTTLAGLADPQKSGKVYGVGAEQKSKNEFTSLVLRMQKGDTTALGEFMDLTQTRLFHFCFGLTTNRSTAEELAQTAYLRAFQSIKKLNEPEKVLSYLFTIARRANIEILRSGENKVTRAAVYQDENQTLLNSIPDSTSGDPELKLIIEQTLVQMKDAEREVLLLVDYNEHSYEEVSEMLGIPVGTVKNRLFRARQSFSEIIEQVRRHE